MFCFHNGVILEQFHNLDILELYCLITVSTIIYILAIDADEASTFHTVHGCELMESFRSQSIWFNIQDYYTDPVATISAEMQLKIWNSLKRSYWKQHFGSEYIAEIQVS